MTAALQKLLSNPKLWKTLAGAGVGTGAAALENKHLLTDADPGAKGINSIMGAATGAMLPHHPWAALGGLTFKQLGLAGLNTYQKDAPLRARIADTNLSAAQATERTAKTNLETAGIQNSQAKEWSPAAKALAVLAGAGVLGAGTYAANSLLKGKKSKPADPKVEKGDAALRKRQKVRFDVPVGALPPEFFQSLATVDQPDERPKRASAATSEDIIDEIRGDLEKPAASFSRTMRTEASRIGKMFQGANTNGKQIIDAQRQKRPMSMDDIALQKQQQEFQRNQQKFQEEQQTLGQERQRFEQEQMLAKHKLDVERMLAKAKPVPPVVAPQANPPTVYKAFGDWAKRLNKDLSRLVTR